jgi:hypothetical protein
MKKMLKRADGSTSQRGLWDNIRANKGSGKKPTKEMLKQEKKIKAESKQTGGDWMQGSNELKFGGPSKPKKYQTAPPPEENINLPTATTTPTYTWTVADQRGEYKEEVKPSRSNIGGRTAGGSNKGEGSKGFDKSCVSGDCLDMMKSKGSSTTNRQNTEGATGLSDKAQIDKSRIVYQTEEEKAEGEANRAYYADKGKAAKEGKKYEAYLRSGEGDYSTGMDPEMVKDKGSVGTKFYTRQKTGGKRKYFKK